MSRHLRAYHPEVPGPGSRVILDEDESHHVTRVLRLAAGDELGLFDGRGGEWTSVVETPSRSATVLRVGALRTDVVEPGLDVVLFQALCRHERLEWAIQKATEIGIAQLHVVGTERSDAPPPSPERLARWRRVAREAAKQSGRRRIPDVHDTRALPTGVPEDTFA